MYYPEGMKARVSPVQSIEPHRILAPTRDSNQKPPGPESRVVTTILPLHTNNVPRWRHDVTKHALHISACRRARKMILFCFYNFLGCQIQKYHRFRICICGHVIKGLHDVMAWLYNVTKLTLSILMRRVAGHMIRCACTDGCLDYLIRKCRCLIRKCHGISTNMMTLNYAVTSWSWRLVTISQISFHISLLDDMLQLSNIYVILVYWHMKIEGILVLPQFHTVAWRHIGPSWCDVVTCWRQLLEIVSMICLTPTTQISIELVKESQYGSNTKLVGAAEWG